MPLTSLNDADLWIAFKKKDKDAFEQIFKMHYESLYLYGYKFTQNKELLEDLIQELFTELWISKSTTEIKSIRAYLLRSLQYKLYKKLRENASITTFDGDKHLDFEVSKETLLVQQQENDERSNNILKCLSKLSARQREIIYLKFYRGMSYDEISEVLNINYQASRNLLSNSLKALRPLLKALTNTVVIIIYLLSFFK